MRFILRGELVWECGGLSVMTNCKLMVCDLKNFELRAFSEVTKVNMLPELPCLMYCFWFLKALVSGKTKLLGIIVY